MGALLSAFDCGLLHALAGDPDYELTLAGAYQTRDAERRLHQQREERICEEIQKRETRCADLEADIGDLEREAVRHKHSAERFAAGSRQYTLSLANARRALVTAQKKRALVAKERKLIGIANAAVERMRVVVDNGADDGRFISELREFTQAVDVGEHTMAADQTRADAGEVLHSVADLLDVQERAVDSIADLDDPEGAAAAVFGGEALSLADDGDLLKALGHLESEHSGRAPSPPQATTADGARFDSVPLSGPTGASMPRVPREPPRHDEQARRVALAVDRDGVTHGSDLGEDPFADIF